MQTAKQLLSGEFLRCLLELDVDGMLRVHRLAFPAGTLPSNRIEALASMHLARTKSERVPRHAKLYSQRWLNERGLGSWMEDGTDRRQH